MSARTVTAMKLPTKADLFAWIDDQVQLEARETLLLNKLGGWADANFEFWVPIATLMQQSRSSERKVRYMLRAFEACGFIADTGRKHRLPESTRVVPIYVIRGFVEAFSAARREVSGIPAHRAPIDADPAPHGGTDEAHGGTGCAPANEQREQTPSDEGDARAQEALRVREGIERAAPKASLGNTDPVQLLAAVAEALAEGFSGDGMIAAAAGWAADKAAKRKDVGLQFWVRDRRFRAWLPEAAPAAAEAAPQIAPEGEIGPWLGVMAEMQAAMGPELFGTWLGRATLGQIGERLYVVAATGVARRWLDENRWTDLTAAWARRDAAGRALSLVSKSEFEALLRRGEG